MMSWGPDAALTLDPHGMAARELQLNYDWGNVQGSRNELR